uniref:non-specific serine/threonine protein kinase n=1 Tax=Anolis carolinensis TaxID=28377 RepID=A0A803TN59_ANOCA
MDDAAVLKKKGYILGGSLGESSFAKVKSAYSERLKSQVAVKITDRRNVPTEFLEKFLPRELEILSTVDHCSIVKIYEIFETSGKVYIVMELCVQGDLLEFIKSNRGLPEEVARRMFRQLCCAVKYCHDLDVVHRDLKCDNVLLDKDMNVKLSDFGFSKRCYRDGDGHIVPSQTFCGSAAYAAPEVILGIPYHPKVYDMWSLGVVLYVMVSGYMPYDDSNVKRMLRLQQEHRVIFPETLSIECKDLIFRMLQPDVAHRLQIEEVLNHPWVQGKYLEVVQSSRLPVEWESGIYLFVLGIMYGLEVKLPENLETKLRRLWETSGRVGGGAALLNASLLRNLLGKENMSGHVPWNNVE